jgi:predicted ATPase
MDALGNRAEHALLVMVSQQSNEKMHGQLWEAGFIFRTRHSYTFIHDRVQEAAYSSISENLRAETHVRIGRLLVARTPANHIKFNNV